MQEIPKVPDGLIPVLDWFYLHYGSTATLLLLSVPIVLVVGLQIWQQLRKDRDFNVALQTKEDSIQRLADENRMYRAVLFREKFGWSEQQIEGFIAKPAVKAKKERSK